MAQIIQFHFIPNVNIESCKFYFEDGQQVDKKDTLDLMRLLSECCSDNPRRQSIFGVQSENLEQFLCCKNYELHLMLFDAAQTPYIAQKIQSINTDTVMFIILAGPEVPLEAFPIPSVKNAMISIKLVEEYDRQAKILLLY